MNKIKIIDVLDTNGNIKNDGLYKIIKGACGILSCDIEIGKPMIFEPMSTDKILTTSKVNNIIVGNKIVSVYTKNSVYIINYV